MLRSFTEGAPDVGFRVAAGDLNNDGMDDLIIANPNWNSSRGRVVVWVSDNGQMFHASDTIEGGVYSQAETGCDNERTWRLGEDVTFLGDWDGDTKTEFAVGVPRVCDFQNSPDRNEGEIRIYEWDSNASNLVEETYSPGVVGPGYDGPLRGDQGDVFSYGEERLFVGGFRFSGTDDLPDLLVRGEKSDGNRPIRVIYYDQVGDSVAQLEERNSCTAGGGSAVRTVGAIRDTLSGGFDFAAVSISTGSFGLVELIDGTGTIADARKDVPRAVDTGFARGIASGSGDANGDGWHDLLVGGQRPNGDRGRITLFSGDPLDFQQPGDCEFDRLDSVKAQFDPMCDSIQDPVDAVGLGEQLVWMGDLNDDGMDNFAASDDRNNGADGLRGIFIYKYNEGGGPANCFAELTRTTNVTFQIADLAAGDFDNDGYLDLVAAMASRVDVWAVDCGSIGFGCKLSDELVFYAFSPVDLVVTDPFGDSIGIGFNTIGAGSAYDELTDVNSADLTGPDGDPDDVVTIAQPFSGSYNIRVVPEAGAAGGDKFTLAVRINGNQLLIPEGYQEATISSLVSQGGTLPDTYTYGVATTLPGDVNADDSFTSSDIIYMVNFVFKGGPAPVVPGHGDVDCNGLTTSADIIGMVNFVFKGGLPPCSASAE